MNRDAKSELVRRVFEQGLNDGKLAIVQEAFSPAFVDRSTPGQAPGAEGVSAYFTQVRVGFPDLHVTIEDMVVEGDKVVVRTTWQGTYLGEYEGAMPTGQRVARTMIQIFRIEAGKIVEEWNEGGHLLPGGQA